MWATIIGYLIHTVVQEGQLIYEVRNLNQRSPQYCTPDPPVCLRKTATGIKDSGEVEKKAGLWKDKGVSPAEVKK